MLIYRFYTTYREKIKCWLCIACFTGTIAAKAQIPSRYIEYDIKDGLSQNSVHALYRDTEGIMWIGTQDGLNSFNGKSFTVYRHSDEDTTSISDQFILSIKEDKTGNLWIGTRNGLNCFNKRTRQFRRYYTSPEQKHQFQAGYDHFIIQDDHKIAIVNEGLHLLDPVTGLIKKFLLAGAPDCNWMIMPDYKAWAITSSGRLFFSKHLLKEKFRSLGQASFCDKNNYSQTIALPYKDSFLFIHDRLNPAELFQYDVKSLDILNRLVLPENFNHVEIVSPSEIYFSMHSGILATGMGKPFQWQKNSPGIDGLHIGAVLTTHKDRKNNLWAGSSGSGVAVGNPSFQNFKIVRPPLANGRVKCIAASGNNIYAGTNNGIYTLTSKEGLLAEQFTTFLPGKNIIGMAADKMGNIWAAEQGKDIFVLDIKGTLVKKIKTGEDGSARDVLRMTTDDRGNVIVCTSTGMFYYFSYNDPPIPFGKDPNGKALAGDYVMDAFKDDNDQLWIANNLGLDVYDADLVKKFSFYSGDDNRSFLKRTIITSVTQDWDGAIWIGTIRNGLYKYFNGRYAHYTHTEGLSSDVVYNVICDNDKKIWATTSAGLSVFIKEKNAFKTLTPFDGVPNSSFSFGAILKKGDQLFFGTSDGLLICDTRNLPLTQPSFDAYIPDIKVNGESASFPDRTLKIIPDNKQVVFELASSPAFFSGEIIYQYKLSGQNKDWITLPQGVHSVSYTGLPYKQLKMQVRAAGSFGNLSTAKVYTIDIYSEPPFYKTTIFILIAGLLGAVAIGLFVMRYNRKRYKKQMQAMAVEKELQKERVRIGRDLHDNIGAYTSALIAGLNRIKTDDKLQRENVADLKDYGANIMGFLRETIWMLNAEKLTVTAFADRFVNYAQRINKNYADIDFRFSEKIEEDKELQPTTMLNLFRILQEALQNACKHSGATAITVSIVSNGQLQFEICDNGKGFEEKQLDGHYGISNIRQRASEAGFSAAFHSNANGTRVIVKENTANAALKDAVQTS